MDDREARVDRLSRARRADAHDRRTRVLAVIDGLSASSQPLPVAELARRADVHRSFIYRHKDLYELAVATPLRKRIAEMEAERDRLRAIVEDITAHATPIAEDDDGFVAVGYTVTVGAIHRALAALQGAAVDLLHPLMPTGEGQVFRDWLDFVERVARPIVEIENDDAAEQAAMALYRKTSPFFICAALVMAANRALDGSADMGDPSVPSD